MSLDAWSLLMALAAILLPLLLAGALLGRPWRERRAEPHDLPVTPPTRSETTSNENP